jgi:hypothetical protein
MVEDQPMLTVEAATDAPAEEEDLPEPKVPMAQHPIVGTTTAEAEIQILTCNLGERIPIAPQIWDVDTDIVILDDSEITLAVPEPPKKSPKEKWKKKWKKAAQHESDGRLVIRLKKAGSVQAADATEDEGRQGGTAAVL